MVAVDEEAEEEKSCCNVRGESDVDLMHSNENALTSSLPKASAFWPVHLPLSD